jgi:DNA-binding transcriptional LysR family regulator
VRDRCGELKLIEPPFAVDGFAVGMVWHERNHGHAGQRWVREKIAALVR